MNELSPCPRCGEIPHRVGVNYYGCRCFGAGRVYFDGSDVAWETQVLQLKRRKR